uniref:Refilin B n=1 Tax=Salarias fasciatus TaxID=181472 RepID=A0A672JH52_SALFA
MVGRLNLPHVCDGEPLDMSCRADRGLDSPDSGLPPSPSPSAWLQPACTDKAGAVSPGSEDEGKGSLVGTASSLSSCRGLQLHVLPAIDPVVFSRYTSSVHYDSDRHFIQDVALLPLGQALEHCRQTVMALPHSTWRHYKTQLDFEPTPPPAALQEHHHHLPQENSAVYTTELSYDCRRLSRRFLSSVELEATGRRELPQ